MPETTFPCFCPYGQKQGKVHKVRAFNTKNALKHRDFRENHDKFKFAKAEEHGNMVDKMELASAKEHRAVVTKSYYEKLGGFSYLLSELNKKIGREQTDIL